MARWLVGALLISSTLAPGCSDRPAPVEEREASSAQTGPRLPTKPATPKSSCGVEASGPSASPDSSELDAFFTGKMTDSGAPGMALAVIRDGQIRWKKGYGLANVEEKRPATPDTLFMLASVTKTVTAVALMSLLEDPKRGISLDDDVNDQLPFRVRNPSFPDQPITYRMLLTHTSSLIDSDDFDKGSTIVQGDSKIPLLDFEKDYVAKSDSWSEQDEPGSYYSYSNTGASLAGLLAEQISKKNLQDYAKATIFGPLGMPEASFFLRDLDASHIAMPYVDGEAQGHYGYPDYPDGELRTSATQLAHFLLMLAGKGACGGARILSEATIAEMLTSQIPDVPGAEATQGLILHSDTFGDVEAMGHDGGDTGVSTEMWFDPTTGNGFVLLTNGNAALGSDDQSDALRDMEAKLMELAGSL